MKPIYGGTKWTFNIEVAMGNITLSGGQTFEVVGTPEESAFDPGEEYLQMNYRASGVVGGSGDGTWSSDGQERFRVRDRALASSADSLKTLFQEGGIAYVLDIRTTQTYDPPRDLLDFPIEDGEEWQYAGEVTTTTAYFDDNRLLERETEVRELIVNMSAGPKRTVTVPAGTFETIQLNGEDSDGTTLQTHYSEKTLSSVLFVTWDVNGTQTTRKELVSYSIAPPPTDPLFALTFWALLILLIVVAIVAVLVRRRRKAKKEEPPYGGLPPRGDIQG